MLLLLLFVSCTENKEAKVLFATVDSLMEEHPDSALSLLNRAYNKKDDWRKSQQMRYELLRAKAQNKAYVNFTTDSIMKEVAEYYDNHGTANEQMEAHYLLGCTYRDLGESPMALSCYLDATEKADTLSDDCDYGTLMRIWGQVANVFEKQYMPHNELEANRYYRKYALTSHDTLNYIVGLELDRNAYNNLSDTAKVFEITKNVIDLYKKYGYDDYAIRAQRPIVPMLINNGCLSEVSKIIKDYEKESNLFEHDGNIAKGKEHFYCMKALYHESINNLDSAEFYYKKSKVSKNNYDACKGLVNVYRKMGLRDSLDYYTLLLENSFSFIYSNLHTQAMFNADGMFNYNRNQRIAVEKEKESELSKLHTIIVMLVSSLLILISVITFYSYRKTRTEEIEKLTEKFKAIEADYQKAIEEFNLMEGNFNLYKEQKEEEIENLRKKREEYLQLYQSTRKNDKLSEIAASNIMNQILTHENILPGHKSKIYKKEWKALFDLFKTKMPQFYSDFILNEQLSERELQVFILTALNVSSKSIAVLLEMSQSYVSNVKTCVNRKLFFDNSARTLFLNIMQYCEKT